MSSQWMMIAAVVYISLLFIACASGLSNDTGLYFECGDEGESNSKRQTIEVFIDGTVPWYMSIAEGVAVGVGETLRVGAEPYVWGCGLASNGSDIRLACYYIPLIDLDDPRRVVAGGAQRYGYGYTTGSVPQDEGKRRSIVLGDQDGNLLNFHRLGDDMISVFFDSGCLSVS